MSSVVLGGGHRSHGAMDSSTGNYFHISNTSIDSLQSSMVQQQGTCRLWGQAALDLNPFLPFAGCVTGGRALQ